MPTNARGALIALMLTAALTLSAAPAPAGSAAPPQAKLEKRPILKRDVMPVFHMAITTMEMPCDGGITEASEYMTEEDKWVRYCARCGEKTFYRIEVTPGGDDIVVTPAQGPDCGYDHVPAPSLVSPVPLPDLGPAPPGNSPPPAAE